VHRTHPQPAIRASPAPTNCSPRPARSMLGATRTAASSSAHRIEPSPACHPRVPAPTAPFRHRLRVHARCDAHCRRLQRTPHRALPSLPSERRQRPQAVRHRLRVHARCDAHGTPALQRTPHRALPSLPSRASPAPTSCSPPPARSCSGATRTAAPSNALHEPSPNLRFELPVPTKD